jgi:hypothetical protein
MDHYATDEGSYDRLANAWKKVHVQREESDTKVDVPKLLVGIVTFFLLSPVIGMLLVFAVLPALPIALLVGIVLGPMNLFNNHELEDEDAAYEVWEARHLAEAHGHA